jgi:hypothetical protein
MPPTILLEMVGMSRILKSVILIIGLTIPSGARAAQQEDMFLINTSVTSYVTFPNPNATPEGAEIEMNFTVSDSGAPDTEDYLTAMYAHLVAVPLISYNAPQ